MNGYPLYLLLALGGYLVLPLSSGASRYHRQLLAAAGLTYVLMLLLKDPLFFPMIFLHAKEDLFFAPVACLLGASFSSYLWSTGRAGRVTVAGILLVATSLAVRDQVLNHDTLKDQRVVRGP